MKHKLLLTCPLTPKGHSKVNNFFYYTLQEKYNVDYIDANSFTTDRVKFHTLLWASRKYIEHNRFSVRILYALRKFSILPKLKNYDVILFLSFEIISLFLISGIIKYVAKQKKIYFLVSNQLDEVHSSRLKKALFSKMSSNFTWLVKEPHMLEFAKEVFPYADFQIVLRNINCVNGSVKESRLKRTIISAANDRKIILCPSKTSSDFEHVKTAINNRASNYFYVILSQEMYFKDRNDTITISDFLSNEDFESLFEIANIIWLPYKKSFKYRSSSLLMEVMRYKKPIVAREIETFKYYHSLYKIGEMYDSYDELYSSFEKAISNPSRYQFDQIIADHSDPQVKKDLLAKIKV